MMVIEGGRFPVPQWRSRMTFVRFDAVLSLLTIVLCWSLDSGAVEEEDLEKPEPSLSEAAKGDDGSIMTSGAEPGSSPRIPTMGGPLPVPESVTAMEFEAMIPEVDMHQLEERSGKVESGTDGDDASPPHSFESQARPRNSAVRVIEGQLPPKSAQSALQSKRGMSRQGVTSRKDNVDGSSALSLKVNSRRTFAWVVAGAVATSVLGCLLLVWVLVGKKASE